MESYLAVLYVSPSDGSVNVPTDIIATATFSESIDETSVTPLTVYIAGSDGEPVESELEYDDTISTIFVAPLEALSGDSSYDLVLDTGLAGANSGSLLQPITASFTTSPAEGSSGSDNTPPTANAGEDQTATVKELVMLDGSFSNDVDSDPLSYSWEFVEWPTDSIAQFDDPTSATPQFIADVEGTFIIGLTVHDGIEPSEMDYVQVFVTP